MTIQEHIDKAEYWLTRAEDQYAHNFVKEAETETTFAQAHAQLAVLKQTISTMQAQTEAMAKL
jgi:hypothetical protein